MFKKILCLALSAIILTSTCITASAQENTLNPTTEYQETYLYVDFTNIDVSETQDGWNIAPKNSLSRSATTTTEADIDNLQALIEEFPDVEDNLFGDVSENNALVGVSFTEVPLIQVEDHYERIPVDTSINARGVAESDENGKGKFLLYTKIVGGTTTEADGYKYTAYTYGSWSVNNILGGSNYPDSGDDFVFQTSPSTFSRISDSLTAKYDTNPTEAVSGEDFWREDGNSSYVRYGIADDPFGFRQNKSFALTTVSVGPQSSAVRHINSYYIHTWSEMSVEVSIDVSSEKSVTLSISPSNTEDSWQVYNPVPFTF